MDRSVSVLIGRFICHTSGLGAIGLGRECATDGRMRYIQTCCKVSRYETNGVPLSCSEYKSYGHR